MSDFKSFFLRRLPCEKQGMVLNVPLAGGKRFFYNSTFHFKKVLDKIRFDAIIIIVVDAALAHPVERHLAKVEVASSSLVSRSIKPIARQ